MNKKQLRQRMDDMLLGAVGGCFYDADVGPMCSLSPEGFFGWVHAVLQEFVPEKHWLREPRNLHCFSDLDKAAQAVWEAMPEDDS